MLILKKPFFFKCFYIFCNVISCHHVSEYELVIKTLECGQKGHGLKLHFEHSSFKNISILGYNDLYVLVNHLLIMSTQKRNFFY
jgi:hypothetical protein